ncbi:MAG TPA: SRPBCC family protein [Longimicrobiaceae bacterium]
MSVSFRTEMLIQAPPAAVMEAMTDLDAWPRWMPALVRVEKLTEGPFDLETRWRETRKVFGREASEVFHVTEFEPPGRLGLWVNGAEGTTGKGEYRFLYLLEPAGEGTTRVTLEGEANMPGLAARVLGFLFRGMLRKGTERDLAALRSWLEG